MSQEDAGKSVGNGRSLLEGACESVWKRAATGRKSAAEVRCLRGVASNKELGWTTEWRDQPMRFAIGAPGLLGLHKPGEPHSPLALTIRPTSHTSPYGRTKPFMGSGCCSYPAGNGWHFAGGPTIERALCSCPRSVMNCWTPQRQPRCFCFSLENHMRRSSRLISEAWA